MESILGHFKNVSWSFKYFDKLKERGKYFKFEVTYITNAFCNFLTIKLLKIIKVKLGN